MDNISLKTILRLFPYISNKKRASCLKIDDDSLHYISLREVANKITIIISHHLKKLGLNKNIIITDATAGVGGNTISFGMKFDYVNAIEIDEQRYEYLVNNISVYNLTNIITFNSDCLDIITRLKHDVIFIDPPWGGKDYKQYQKLRISLSNKPIESICNEIITTKIHKPPKLIVLKLPTNYDIEYIFKIIKSDTIYLHKLKKMLIIVIVT
jgi:16S rRNA G966 N2-methylase RsmD